MKTNLQKQLRCFWLLATLAAGAQTAFGGDLRVQPARARLGILSRMAVDDPLSDDASGLETQNVGDALWQFVRVMRHENEAGAGRLDHLINYAHQEPAVALVETLTGFVKYQQAGVFHQRSSQQDDALVSQRQFP